MSRAEQNVHISSLAGKIRTEHGKDKTKLGLYSHVAVMCTEIQVRQKHLLKLQFELQEELLCHM